MSPEARREVVVLLARVVAHLYGIASVCASVPDWDDGERDAEIDRVTGMLRDAAAKSQDVPACAPSLLEQATALAAIAQAGMEPGQVAMAVARGGLLINTWVTATTMLVTSQSTEGPLTLGGLMQLLGTLQPDPRYRAALAGRLSAVAYDNSAIRQLGSAYFLAFEGYSLLELHQALDLGDVRQAGSLFDQASRGALIATGFLEGCPGEDEAEEGEDEAEEDEPAVASSPGVAEVPGC